jgi:HSP20 family protein
MLTRWNDPLKNIKALQNQVTRMLGEVPMGLRTDETATAMWAPPADVIETDDRLTFSFEVPGFRQDELTLHVENGVLSLEGDRKFEEETKDKNYHRIERAYGHFMRSFALPMNVDAGKVSASLADGVLKVDIPKREEAKPKAIPIAAGTPKPLAAGKK